MNPKVNSWILGTPDERERAIMTRPWLYVCELGIQTESRYVKTPIFSSLNDTWWAEYFSWYPRNDLMQTCHNLGIRCAGNMKNQTLITKLADYFRQERYR